MRKLVIVNDSCGVLSYLEVKNYDESFDRLFGHIYDDWIINEPDETYDDYVIAGIRAAGYDVSEMDTVKLFV